MNSNRTIAESTLDEFNHLIDCGCERISSTDLKRMIDELGYRIDTDGTFDYINDLNGNTYAAKSISIVDIGTGKSFANIDVEKGDRLRKLQGIRLNYVVYECGKLWDL